MRFLIAFLAAMFAFPAAAHAEWYEASSDHFVIYAEDKEKDVLRFAEQLERYHAAMTAVTQREASKPSPSNRVTIYVVGSTRDVQQLYSGRNSGVAGFYQPRAGGSVAFTSRVKTSSRETDFSMIILLHEYAHHYLMSSVSFGLPRWFTEGSAEFFSSAGFEKDGGMTIGRPATHRAYSFANGRSIHVRELFEYEKYKDRRNRSNDTFYAKSWLLYHYLIFNQERAPQVRDYLVALVKGASEEDAAKQAFGDFDELETELDRYSRARKMRGFSLTADQLPITRPVVRKLSEGHAAAMPLIMRSKRGVNEEQAAEVVQEMRRVAARYPGDAHVLEALAEAEHDSRNSDKAIAAADAAIAIDPTRTNAYLQKGYALFRLAEDAEDESAAYTLARQPFLALNRREAGHPVPLSYYYRSFVEQGQEPPAAAKRGLLQAVMLAPFDLGLRMDLARLQIADRNFSGAKVTLAPVAVHPHADNLAERAKEMLAKMDEDPDWDGQLDSDAGTAADAEVEDAADDAADDGADGGADDASDGDQSEAVLKGTV